MNRWLFVISGMVGLQVSAANRPNILFVMSDDHTSQAIGAYGGRLAALNPTPKIDSIAKNGTASVELPCGRFRFVDIELAAPFQDERADISGKTVWFL